MIEAQRNLSVLTIDDDTDMRRSIVSYLEDMDFTVYQASGGREGLEMFDRYHPDLVFTDLMMPEVDGITVVNEITKKSPGTPVVVISGNGSVEYAIKAVRNGAWDYITKPIHDFSTIDRIADQVFDRAHAMKAEKLSKESKEQDNKIEQLASGIAHDFKNILTGIVGNLSIAQIHLDDTHKSSIAIKRAEKASGRANQLAQQLMNIGRPAVPAKKTADVWKVIHECVDLTLTNPSIICTVDADHDIPDAAIDEGELCQILNNLTLNAVQAMPEGGRLSVAADTICIESDNEWSLAAGSYVRIRINDTGCGISPDALKNVFDTYFTTKQSGNGLGLASVKNIIDKYNAKIVIGSEVGAGTTVIIVIPATL